jgi:WD40 repeat protein
LWDVDTGKNTATLAGHSGYVNSVRFSPDGRTLASGSKDQTINLWDLGTRENLATLIGHSQAVTSLAFSPDGRTLASASGKAVAGRSGAWSGELRLWRIADEH